VPYTLAMFFLWGFGMASIGVVIGWLLRSQRGRTRGLAPSSPDGAETERLQRRVADLEPIVAERDRLRIELADVRGSSAGALGFSNQPLDLDAAQVVLDRDIVLDDLTVLEGIGPKIVELCAGIGVTTWRQLAETDPAMLKTMLEDGGSQFKTHDPGSWPHQAGLLADGRWEEFKTLTDELDNGR
jgi:predicted flap endonuclease-1-like 5' DNA nuclease